jgi:hypothetical protein
MMTEISSTICSLNWMSNTVRRYFFKLQLISDFLRPDRRATISPYILHYDDEDANHVATLGRKQTASALLRGMVLLMGVSRRKHLRTSCYPRPGRLGNKPCSYIVACPRIAP